MERPLSHLDWRPCRIPVHGEIRDPGRARHRLAPAALEALLGSPSIFSKKRRRRPERAGGKCEEGQATSRRGAQPLARFALFLIYHMLDNCIDYPPRPRSPRSSCILENTMLPKKPLCTRCVLTLAHSVHPARHLRRGTLCPRVPDIRKDDQEAAVPL